MNQTIPSFLLRVYKNTFSTLLFFLFGRGCRFTPTCSEYSAQAITKYGIFKGTNLSVKRLLKCNPLNEGGFDPLK